MALTSRIGRPLLASMFVVGGAEQLLNTAEKAKAVQDVADDIAEPLGLPSDPETLVRINGAVQLAAGSMLALGKLPRLSALALAGTLVPTTYAAHRFWEEEDPEVRQRQKVAFTKNVAMLGGLIIAAGDTEGRPSVAWRTRQALDRTKPAAQRAADAIEGDAVPAIADAAATVSSAVADTVRQAAPAVKSAAAAVARAWSAAREAAVEAVEVAEPVVRERAGEAQARLAELADDAGPKLRETAAHARELAAEAREVARPYLDDGRHYAQSAQHATRSAIEAAKARTAA